MAVALVGWGLAELKAKSIHYHHNDEEIESEKKNAVPADREMNISDVIENISAKGFKTL